MRMSIWVRTKYGVAEARRFSERRLFGRLNPTPISTPTRRFQRDFPCRLPVWEHEWWGRRRRGREGAPPCGGRQQRRRLCPAPHEAPATPRAAGPDAWSHPTPGPGKCIRIQNGQKITVTRAAFAIAMLPRRAGAVQNREHSSFPGGER